MRRVSSRLRIAFAASLAVGSIFAAAPARAFAQSANDLCPPRLIIVRTQIAADIASPTAAAIEQGTRVNFFIESSAADAIPADERPRGEPAPANPRAAERSPNPLDTPPVRVRSADANPGEVSTQTAAVPAPPIAPLLAQLSAETQALHEAIAASTVRVHWPDAPMADAGPAEDLLRKWEQRLEPSVKQKLLDQIAAVRAMRAAAGAQVSGADPLAAMRNLQNSHDPLQAIDPMAFADLAPLGIPAARPRGYGSVTLGVVMDNRGLLVVPEYVDREWAIQRPIRVSLPGGGEGNAAFVGSDRPTGLTVLRLPIAFGKPASLAQTPGTGAIVMIFGALADHEHLAIWRGPDREPGIVALTDGRIAGFESNGQFLSADAAAPVIQQLGDSGTVRRPVLGVLMSELQPGDPRRQFEPLLGDAPAMRIEKVQAGSAADRAGLRPDDLIVAISDKPASDVPTFAALIAARSGPTDLRILRAGVLATVSVDLQRPPQ